MTILEDLKSGRLVVVPREANAALIAKIMQYVEDIMVEAEVDYPAGREAGCRVSYDSDAIEKYIASALSASPDHTAGLIAMVEGMERERDEALMQLSDEMVIAAMRAFEPMSSVLRYREKDGWHTCDQMAMRAAIKAALNVRNTERFHGQA